MILAGRSQKEIGEAIAQVQSSTSMSGIVSGLLLDVTDGNLIHHAAHLVATE